MPLPFVRQISGGEKSIRRDGSKGNSKKAVPPNWSKPDKLKMAVCKGRKTEPLIKEQGGCLGKENEKKTEGGKRL